MQIKPSAQPMGRIGLIGDTGFVGGALIQQIQFDRTYNSRSIDAIRGEVFDVLICAGAPATMWIANAAPEADAANLERLAGAIGEAKIARLVLISTIAVFDDVSRGYTESTAHYEQKKAYGANRRRLEVVLQESHDATVVRLPALFGPGLKKNFIFDIINPIPSFIKDHKFKEVQDRFSPAHRALLDVFYAWDDAVSMYRLDRQGLKASGDRDVLLSAFEQIDFTAVSFTNSESRYQFYNVVNLAHDIGQCMAAGIDTLNVCSEPWRAGDLHELLTGRPHDFHSAPVVSEDVRTDYASVFGGDGDYLYDRASVLDELKAFVARERSQ